MYTRFFRAVRIESAGGNGIIPRTYTLMTKDPMRQHHTFHETLIRRFVVLFLGMGLLPTLLLAIVPTVYVMRHGTEALRESLLVVWGAQGLTFVIIVLCGASIMLRRLALPIQELANGAGAIAAGDLSYRVPIRSGEQELVLLSQAFNKMAEAVETMRDDIDRQRAALLAALDEREREFDAILQITSLVNSQTDLHSTVARALKTMQGVLGTDIMSLVLFDEMGAITSTVSQCKACESDASGCREHCVEYQQLRQCLHMMQGTLFPIVMERKETLRIDDVLAPESGLNDELVGTLTALGLRKMAIKPLIFRGQMLGALVLMRPEMQNIPVRASTLLDALAENIAVLIKNWQLQNKSRKLTIMEERRRLASELHDSVTQSLFTLSLTARGLKASLAAVPGINEQPLDVLVDQAKLIQGEMRTLINELRPIDLTGDDLESALRQHVQSLRRSAGTDVTLTIQGPVRDLSQAVQQTLNRIAQEALSNIARHSNASRAQICLDVSERIATLTIQDNGVGFDPRQVGLGQAGSLGLVSMRERAEMLCGALLVRSQPGKSTSITARIPLAPERVNS
jgi:nitrate/nitrite-specific signal transduction histidine kinase